METKKIHITLFKSILTLFCTVILVLYINNKSFSEEVSSKNDFRVAWLKQNAVPLRSIDPNDEDFSDLEPLAKAIGNARIVQLGEQTHGDGATFYAKTRLIKFLHQKLGFDVIAFESGLYDCHKAWELLLSGTEPYEAFRNGVFGIWGISAQVRPLIEYWGRAARSNRPLELCGFDCQFTARACELLREDVNNLLNKLGTDSLSTEQRTDILETLTKLSDLQRKPRDPNQEELELLQSALSLWGKALDDAKPSVVLSENELAFWRQFVASTSILPVMVSDPNAYGNLREQQIARNLIWLARTAYPNRKIIVWAASYHIGRHQDKKGQNLMGHELDKLLGQEVYTIAFTAAEGWWKVPYLSTGVQLEPPAVGSLESLFVQAGFENAFVDFRKLDADGVWLKEKLIARPFGYANEEANWTEVFDAFIFTKHMTGNTYPGQRVPINPPIFAAVQSNDVDWVKRLLEEDKDINLRTRTGDTPLIYAAASGDNKTVVELLIAKGADVNAKNNSGETPLLVAARRGRKEVVELLIEKGADTKAKNNQGQTPLTLAAINGQVDIAEMLLAKGADSADFTVQDNRGRTPLGLAKENGNTEMVELISKHTNQSGDNKEIMTFFDYVALGDIEKVKSLILEGINVNAKTQNGSTALFWASAKGHREIAELLIQNGADVNAKIRSGQTPLILACQNGHRDVVELLLNKEADTNVKNNAGRTPFDIATNRGHTEIVELLRKHGAKE